jgi:hypothetical protein
MNARMTEPPRELPQLSKQIGSFFCSQPLGHAAGVPDAQHGFAINSPIVRLMEIPGNDVAQAPPGLSDAHVRGVEAWRVGGFVISADGWEKDIPWVVGPHDRKLHVVPVFGEKEAVFERLV